MKQILLITDGCSNVGVDPAIAAAHALDERIVVNVVGVVSEGDFGERGMEEVTHIAQAGGGMSRIVDSRQLSGTVQMVTRKTMMHTIQQTVQQELKQIVGGSGSIEELSPYKRAEVVKVMDDLGENTDLKVLLLIDTSASMKPKLAAVESAIHDLMLSLQARKGKSELAVLHFPAGSVKPAGLLQKWTSELAKTSKLFYKLKMKGTTPTGPAILQAVRYYKDNALSPDQVELAPSQAESENKDGYFRDYIV